ncbi:MAG TPA: hypothetical protein VM925_13675 [Labilithrix sp.]|nr:hypothetical protein [Labilithrix sp.]
MSDTNNPPPADNETPEMLPDALSWAAGGHASDVVLTALADGQLAIVLPAVRVHVEGCTICTTHLGHAALLSIHVGAELAARIEHERSLARRPFPWLAVAVGLVVAAVGLLPTILDTGLSSGKTFLARDVPILWRGMNTLRRHVDAPGSTTGLLVTYAAAALLLAMGLAVARSVSKAQKETPR